jgi:tripartite-type tricarboxylate transporter receptor subunit TctC
MLLPAGTPQAIVDKWSDEVRRIVAMPDVVKKIHDMGYLPVGNTSAEFGRQIASDLERWGAVVKATGIKLD